ncbi:MAG: copper amine oxidase N-terminal domain-containing protein [Paenibacillaceae bacterium]
MKTSKKITLSLCLLSSLILGSTQVTKTVDASVTTTPVLLKVNDYYVLYTTPKAPYLDTQNRIMIPLRSISELLGAKVGYDAKTKIATIKIEGKTVTYQIGSKAVTVNEENSELDTRPVIYKNSMFIPLSSLIKNLNIESKWDQTNKLYSLSGEGLMQTDMIKNWEELDHFEGPVQNNNAFMPLSYVYNITQNTVKIKSKNISGTKILKGAEDVHPYFIFENSAQFDKADRERPFVEKDGIVEYTWTLNPGIIDGKKETLQYILVKGRTLDKNSD